MMKCACRDCTNRFVGCHSSCTYYAEFRAKCEHIKKDKIKNTTLTENGIKRLNRNKRICRNFQLRR